MFGIDGKQLEPIHVVAKKFDPNYNPGKLGAWGILFLCCGALAVRNNLWRDRVRNSDIFVGSLDLDKAIEGSDVCTSDDYAIKFSEHIKKWSNDSSAIIVIEKRMEKLREKFSEKMYINQKAYLVLAFMLNSLQDITREELLGFDCRTWISLTNSEQRIYDWPELFFAAGIILNNDVSVGWPKMVSLFRGFGKSSQIDVTALFELYAGENPFLKSGNTKIRTDQLNKGTRIRMRSGWEAIVVKKCDGNTLIAKVFGDFTETGSIYAHDVVAAFIDGKWINVEMTEEQAQFYEQIKYLNERN